MTFPTEERKYIISEICGDWSLHIKGPGTSNNFLFFKSRNNAELVKSILEWENAHPNKAVPYKPTLTPPNEPLSIEQLREMDGEPVWVVYDQDAAKTTPGFDPLTLWALVEVTKDSVLLTNNLGGRTAYADNQDLEWEGITVYRRPPEGEANE